MWEGEVHWTVTTALTLQGRAANLVLNEVTKQPNLEADVALMHQDLTADLELFARKLEQLSSQGNYSSFDLSSIFALISSKFPEILRTSQKNPPETIYRVIIIYSRSSVMPFWDNKQVNQELLDCPNFFLDCLYLHAKVGSDNDPQGIYDFLTEIEGKDHFPYFFETSTSQSKFYHHMTELIAHPNQRPNQQGCLKTNFGNNNSNQNDSNSKYDL